MAEITFHGVRLRFSFGFFALWAWLLASGGNSIAATAALFSCLLHEAGHIIAMNITGIPITMLTFYAGGIAMRSKRGTDTAGTAAEVMILSAGCMVNLIICLVSFLLGARIWVYVNLSLCLFNLLPFSSLDGGRLIRTAAVNICPWVDIDTLQHGFDIVFGIAAVIFFITHSSMNFTLPVAMAFIIAENRIFGKTKKLPHKNAAA